MPSPAWLRLVLLALLLGAPQALAADHAPAIPSLLHRSSLAAVLAQRGALELTPDQVRLLERADERLARAQEAARASQPHPEDAPPGRPPGGSGPGPVSGGPGAGMGGGKARPGPPPRSSGPSPAELLEQQLDALDTQAFLAAVESLPEPQREKVTDVASRHREQVFEQREREKSR